MGGGGTKNRIIGNPLFFPLQIFGAARAHFRLELIQKSKSGGGKNLKEFELYLPV